MCRCIDASKLRDFFFSESSGVDEQINDFIEAVGLTNHEDEAQELCKLMMDGFINIIDTEDTCNIVESPRAEWKIEYHGSYNRVRCICTNCDMPSGIGGTRKNQLKPFCPNCGAKMDFN